jgi:hypothetical protein
LNVGWKDYWPFLDTFTNLASQDGLRNIEAYLMNRFQDAGQKLNQQAVRNSGNKKYKNTKHAIKCYVLQFQQSRAKILKC